MVSIGYELASEEQGPNDLGRLAAIAEDSGFVFALMMPRRFFLGVGTGEDLKSAPEEFVNFHRPTYHRTRAAIGASSR